MKDIFLVPVGDDWISDFEKTVETPVDISSLNSVRKEISDYDEIRIWGTERSEEKRPYFERMEKGDILLFYREKEFFATGRVGMAFESPEAGRSLYDNEESSFLYTVTDFEEVSLPAEELWDLFGYEDGFFLRGFTGVSNKAMDSLLREYNSVEEAYQSLITEEEEELVTEEEGEQESKDEEEEDVDKEGPKTHTEIQWKLIQIGMEQGHDVYVAKNDVNRTYQGNKLSDGCVEEISLTGFSESVVDIICPV